LFGYSINGQLYVIKHRDIGIGFIVLRAFRFGTVSFCFEVSPNSTEEVFFTKQKKAGHNSQLPGSSFDRSSNANSPLPPLLTLNSSGQYIMDFRTRKFRNYDPDNFERFLKDIDSDLYSEFSKLSRSKKKDMMFIYLNKVNEKHSIYFKN
jgi:hypothetical protein